MFNLSRDGIFSVDLTSLKTYYTCSIVGRTDVEPSRPSKSKQLKCVPRLLNIGSRYVSFLEVADVTLQ